MHIKLQINVRLPTHRVARLLLVPESYTLDNLSTILQASLGWPHDPAFSFKAGERSWLSVPHMDSESLSIDEYLADGVSLVEMLTEWRHEEVYFVTGSAQRWEFRLQILGLQESHPSNLTSMLIDGHGDMPVSHNQLRKLFLAENDVIFGGHDKTSNVAEKKAAKTMLSKFSVVDCSFSKCAELVSQTSVTISADRKPPEY